VTDTNVFQLSQPGSFADPLTEVLRNGARALLAQAVEAEVVALLSDHADKLTDDGHQRLVRHGHLPKREIMTGIGPVAVRCPRVRDRVGEGPERIRFSSAILPPYARRSKSLEVLIPILYLKGISTGDFEEVLLALLGKDAGGLSASTIGRLKDAWSDEHARWSKRDLSGKRYVYFSNRPSGSSALRLSTTSVSMSLTCSCFSSDSAPRLFHHGIRRRGGTIFWAALPSV